jgi:hypothetical protein
MPQLAYRSLSLLTMPIPNWSEIIWFSSRSSNVIHQLLAHIPRRRDRTRKLTLVMSRDLSIRVLRILYYLVHRIDVISTIEVSPVWPPLES